MTTPSCAHVMFPSLPRPGAVAGFLLVASLLVALRAQAWLGETKSHIMDLHRMLLDAAEVQRTGGTYSLRLNGARFRVQSASTELSVDEVLERTRQLCSPRGDAESLVPTSMVERADDEAYLVCFKSPESLDIEAILRVRGRIESSGSVSELGQLAGVYARKTATGTAFLSWFPEGELNPASMFPAHGDAPGGDIAGLPRPRGTRRLAAGLGGSPALTAYATRDSQLEEMRHRLVEEGWHVPPEFAQDHAATTRGAPRPAAARRPAGLAFLVKDATRTVLVVDSPGEEEHILTLAELP